MKSTLYLTAICLTMMSCQKEVTVESIVNDYESRIAEYNAWQYDIHYKIKYFSGDDTLDYYTNCRLIRHDSDTFFGGIVWIKDDSIERYYDLNHIYIIKHNEKKIKKYFPKKGQEWAIKGNAISGTLNSHFLRPNRFSGYLEDTTNVLLLNDTVISTKDFNVIDVRFPDNEPFEQSRKLFYFNTDNDLEHITHKVKFQNDWQYKEWHFSNEKYNSITDEMLNSEFDSLAKLYTIEEYEEPESKETQPLANGLKAPFFKGFHLQAEDSVTLGEYSGKFVILDFWYKNCYPCILAIPSLNKLRDKYSDDELSILGLNPYDSKEDREKLKEFIEYNEMSYPTVFIDRDVAEDYKVLVYPTFYLIDEEGKIVHSELGYGEKGEKKIDSLLNVMIQ